MQIRFGDFARVGDVKSGVRQGLASYATNNPQGLPVQMQADQFTRMEDKLERIATSVETMARHFGNT